MHAFRQSIRPRPLIIYMRITSKAYILVCFLFLGYSPLVLGQEEHHSDHPTEKGIFEIITSGIISYNPSEDEVFLGSETHFMYWWNHTWGGGLSYTARFHDGHILSDMALLGSVNATDWLTINAGPNFALPDNKVRNHLILGLYAETEFNYRVSDHFHFGILTGTVISEETEFTTGIHLGFEF